MSTDHPTLVQARLRLESEADIQKHPKFVKIRRLKLSSWLFHGKTQLMKSFKINYQVSLKDRNPKLK